MISASRDDWRIAPEQSRNMAPYVRITMHTANVNIK